MATLYDVLGVRSSATAEQIRRAYVAKARELHPDSHGVDTDVNAGRAMQDVNEAWRVLREPARRAAYDRSIRVAVEAPDANGAIPADATALDDRPYPRRLAEPGDLTVAIVRAAPWVAVVVVLVAIFVFTAFANNDATSRPDLFGECVVIEDGHADGVPCSEPNDGRVVGIVDRSNLCAGGSLAKVVSGGQWYCLRPSDDD